MLRRYWKTILAVLGGNLLYLVLERYLPAGARHQTYRIDWGLAVDFWLCVVLRALLARV